MCSAGAVSLLDMGKSEGPQKEAGWQDKRVHSGEDWGMRQPSRNTEQYRSTRISTIAVAKPGAPAGPKDAKEHRGEERGCALAGRSGPCPQGCLW